ncbi:MAG: hypothetical protein LUB59_00650 [Candidatus Gastranaerophilales bacterium]|nr:hypothetical protein [Candidatus Gastranaerophilales bacterium]
MVNSLTQIWNNILQSNLFNFVVMLFVLGWIIKKFDIADKIEQGRRNIEDKIILSKLSKENALTSLYEVQSETKEVDDEVFNILEKSDKNAIVVGERLIEDAHKQAEEFNKAVQKTIDGNIKALRLKLSDRTAKAALMIAKKHIQSELDKDKSLHIKFINESIEALNGVEL